MKKFNLLISNVALLALLSGCGKTEEEKHVHVDANKDHICDTCEKEVTSHGDTNNDGICDICGQKLVIECEEHVDSNKDGKCDVCGEDVSQEGEGQGQGQGSEGDIEIKPIEAPTVFEECMKYDYSNMFAYCVEITGYQMGYESYEAQGYWEYEYYLGNGKYVVFDYGMYSDYIDSGYPMDYFMYNFADYNGRNYYWCHGEWVDDQQQGHPYAGYIINNKYGFSSSMSSNYFYMNNLLNNISVDDFVYSSGTFVVKPEKMASFNENVLGYAYEIESTVAGIDIGKDANGKYYFKKIAAYVDPESERSPLVMIELQDFGTTTSPYDGEPVTPTESNTFDDYYEMSGEPEPINIYIDSLEMKAYDNVKYRVDDETFFEKYGKHYADVSCVTSDDQLEETKLYYYHEGAFYDSGETYAKPNEYQEYDIILHEGESIDVSLFIGPDDWTKEGLTEWRFTGDTKVEKSLSEDGIYPTKEDGFVGAFGYINDAKIYEPTDELKHVHRHNWFTGVYEGELEIWAEHTAPFEEDTVSNKLKVKVIKNDSSTQDASTSAYSFHFLDAKRMLNDPNDLNSGYWRTEFAATNLTSANFSNPDFEITGMRVDLLSAKYTDAFEGLGDEQLLHFGVGDSNDYQSSSYNYVLFDFGDQEVSSMSCYFSLHRSNQSVNYSNLDEAFIETSSDGVTWDRYNLKNKLVNNWKDASTRGSMNAMLYEREFSNNARYVRFMFKSINIGKILGVVVSDLNFYSDISCKKHVAKEYVDVTGLSVAAPGLVNDSITLSAGKSVTLTSSIAPANATNKRVHYTSYDPKVAKVNQLGEVTAVAAGVTTIEVYTDYVDGDGVPFTKLITIKVGEKPTIPAKYNGQFMNASDPSNIMGFNVDPSNSALIINVMYIDQAAVMGRTLYLDDIISNGISVESTDYDAYVFKDGALEIKVCFINDNTMYVKSYSNGSGEVLVEREASRV